MGDMERAAQALRTGATLPPEASPVLADLLESHHTVAVGKHPPKGWLMVDMAAIDMARAITGERTDPQRDRGNAIEALRGGAPVPAEASARLAELLDEHRRLEPSSETPQEWLAVRDTAGRVAQAVIDGMH
ncbi:hypothetical protein [Saccharopolyspora rosea]|uniref:Uncharacterized protein n=1 Tax=Saccharopolyspora rosea TaxID=524884 RepID=A0ABW3G3D7_9PSEU|nr:hypothetical protein [Saccharopolyspora rosea]